MVHKLFDKKTSSRGIENKNILNKELGEESQCVIDVFSKHARVISLKKKIGMTIINAFKKILKEFNGKPNKIWVDKRKKFYNRSMKSWLETNAIKMRPTHNEGKSVIVERFIRALKNKSNKYMTSVSKIDKLDYITNKYNNTYHSTIKIKPSSSKESNNKDSKFKIGDIVRISKYKNIFAKDYVPNWSEEIFLIKKIKNTAL